MSIDLKFKTQIERPVEVVCAAITDLQVMPRWSSIKEVRHLSDGPLEVGRRFQVVTEVMGKDRVVDYKVFAYEPCKKFAYRSTGSFRSQITMSLAPLETGTQLTFEFSAQVNRFIAPLIKGQIHDQTVNDLTRLVEILETSD